MRQAKGFTLLEVLIGAGLILIGVGSIGLTVISVRRSFKDVENRSWAMRMASAKIDEFLLGSYSSIETHGSLPCSDAGLNCNFTVTTETASGVTANIPFKKAEVVVSYTADRGSGGINSVKNVRLTNIVAYPLAHLTAVRLEMDADAKVPWVQANEKLPFTSGGASVVGSDDSRVFMELKDLQYNVDKTIGITYTIALNVADSKNEIGNTDTVYTACFLDGTQYGVITRTPLLSQPTFSNNVVLEKSKVNKDTRHTIAIRWYYTNGDEKNKAYTAAKISLRQAVLSALAVE